MAFNRFFGGPICVAVKLVICFCAADAAWAQAEAPPKNNPDPQELVVGDCYEVANKRVGKWHGEGLIEGLLVMASDDWIVLGTLLCSGDDEPRYPVLEDINLWWERNVPVGSSWIDCLLSNKFLTKRVPHYSKGFYWIRRDAVKIVRRDSTDCPSFKVHFRGDAPTFAANDEQTSCSVVYVDGEKVSQAEGYSASVDAGEISVVDARAGVRLKGERNGDKVTRKLPLANVSYVFQWVPYFEYAKRMEELKLLANER